MLYPLISAVASAAVLYLLYKRFQRRISISHIRGPPAASWLYGNWLELMDCPAAETDFRWQAEYGEIIRVTAPLGENRLMISDPKAMQYVYHTASYGFLKPVGRTSIFRSLFGPGLTTVEGDDHRRARKIMLPGFGGPESRAYLPIFFSSIGKVAQKWQDMIAADEKQTTVVSIPQWVSRATLDAIGEAAFDYQFGSVDDSGNALAEGYNNMFFDMFGIPTPRSILSLGMIDEIPLAVTNFILKYLRPKSLSRADKTTKLSTEISRTLVEEKTAALLADKGRRDVLSLLVKANHSENPKARLLEKELLGQMNTIILAGHETTANTLSFAFYELCKHQDIQRRLRAEIRSMGKTGADYTSSDFDNMPYLTAFVKETLRFHPIVYNTFRVAAENDVLPLLNPITTDTGEVLNKLPIPKGTKIITSVAAYNRNKIIFGDDAHVFNPDRWLRKDPPKGLVSLGVYGSLFTFVGGSRSCIGWRFAVLELHAFLTELIGKFEFEFTEEGGASAFRREACNLMTPTMESDRAKGSQLPVRVRMARDEEA
ncbi:cytochrome P450 [Hymenopellis radicata]|nr:cytochrome P450 [Hymenopellis radicata]